MSAVLVWTGVVLGIALAAWAAWRLWRDRPVVLRQLYAAGVVETYLVVQLVVVLVHPAAGGASGLFWVYVVAQLVLLPAAAAWAFAERTRWSSAVLLLAALVVALLQVRLLQVWGQG